MQEAMIKMPERMRAAVLRKPGPISSSPLEIEEIETPSVEIGRTIIKVLACGVCRTDLHIVEGELPLQKTDLIPGHQIIGEVVCSYSDGFKAGDRVGVSWLGGTDGVCKFCGSNRENLCEDIAYTGYSYDGGYAEYASVRTDFLIRLPQSPHAALQAPLLCAGIIGFRSLRIAEVKPGMKVGLFGFGSSARLVMPILQAWECEVYVATRERSHQKRAEELGAQWVGGAFDRPLKKLDAAITFAPSGKVVIAALNALEKGGIVAINAIHLDEMPAFDYDSLLWGERQLRSVTNMTRDDARDFLRLVADIGIKPSVQIFPLEEANEALRAMKQDELDLTAVIVPEA